MDIDADTLATLTPEEIAAIRDEPSEAELAALQAIADGADDDDDDDGDGDDTAAAPAAAPAPAPAAAAPAQAADDGAAAAAAPAAQAPAPAAAAPESAPEFKPQYVAELPEDFDARKAANATAEAEAYAKFEAGDLDAAGLRTALTEASTERTALDRLQTKYEIAQEQREQNTTQAWQNTVNGFVANVAKNEGIDYNKDPARADDLDTFVKALAKNDANADKPMSWFLTEAHKRVKALYGDVAAPATASAPTAAQAIAAAAAARKPDASAAPKTLAQVPGGDGPGDIAGEFAGLDNLEGDALEDAIARMSPAMREKYSRGL